MTEAKREKLRASFLSQLPADTTEAEKAVYVESQFSNHVTMIISRSPFTGIPNDEDIVETVSGIRKRTVENVMAAAAHRHPDAHIALFSTSDESAGLPIYVYR